MIILQVLVGAVEADVEANLVKRFGKFYETSSGKIEYPVSCDSHAFDVYADEFVSSDEARPVDFAAVIELPYDYDAFEPFTEEDAGVTLAEMSDVGWVDPAA